MTYNVFLSFLLFVVIFYAKPKVYSYSLIELINNHYIRSHINYKNIENHILLLNLKYRPKVVFDNYNLILEDNLQYDDILFLLPLYKIIVKSRNIILCSNSINNKPNIKVFNKIYNYTIYNSCIYFDIEYLKYLHINTNLFRFCKFNTVLEKLKSKEIVFINTSICNHDHYTNDYSIVTTAYKRNNFDIQYNLFLNQSISPKSIILVHDRNYVNISINKYNNKVLYIHTLNFAAGFFFRYLAALLSPNRDVIIYDDDWFAYDKLSHQLWFDNIVPKGIGIFGHHAGKYNGISWCATPLLIHRKWLLLMWYSKIIEPRTAEDGHLSFSLLLLCNIKCKSVEIKKLQYKNDNLSSSGEFNITKMFWYNITKYIKKSVNSVYINAIKYKYNIF